MRRRRRKGGWQQRWVRGREIELASDCQVDAEEEHEEDVGGPDQDLGVARRGARHPTELVLVYPVADDQGREGQAEVEQRDARAVGQDHGADHQHLGGLAGQVERRALGRRARRQFVRLKLKRCGAAGPGTHHVGKVEVVLDQGASVGPLALEEEVHAVEDARGDRQADGLDQDGVHEVVADLRVPARLARTVGRAGRGA